MAGIPSSVIRDDLKLGRRTLEEPPSTVSRTPSSAADGIVRSTDQSSDLNVEDTSMHSSSLLEDGLPDYDNWPGFAGASFDDSPFILSGPTYSAVESGRTRLSADWLHIVQDGNRRYSLRDVDSSTFRGSCFQDLDKSGDYNPDLKPAQLARPQKSKARKIEKAEDLDDGDYGYQAPKRQQPRTLSYEQGRKNGSRMILRLSVSSELGIEKFKALTQKSLWPYGKFDDKFSHSGAVDDFRDSAYGGSKSPFKGKTGVDARRSAARINDKTHDHPYQNPEEVYENLLGHREARGCRDCYDLGLECSLIDSCLSYPCDNCQEDDQDCILITSRNQKRLCEQCKHKRLPCSFNRAGDDGIAACDNCQDANIICIAGPAKSFRIDDVLASISNKGPNLKAIAKTEFCTKCRKNKIMSSAGSKNRICKTCCTSNSPCPSEAAASPVKMEKKPRAPPRKRSTRTKTQLQASGNSNKTSSRQPRGSVTQKKPHEKSQAQKFKFTFDSDLESTKPKFSASVPGGKIMHITTSYCHPINFNWIPPAPLSPCPYSPPRPPSEVRASSFPCHFCTDPGISYALAGLGTKRVEVIQWEHDSAAGYEELEDGWVQAGEEGTRMCIECTMERVMICLCTDHEIRPIRGLDPKSFDFDSAMAGILNQILNRGKSAHEKIISHETPTTEVKWCSICIEPAFFECCVRPAFTKSGLETSLADDIGCGLLLCEVCAFRMRGNHPSCQSRLTNSTSNSDGGVSTKQSKPGPVRAVTSLDEHIRAAAKDAFHYPDGLRADVCFLTSDGELMRRQGAGAGGAHDDADTDDIMAGPFETRNREGKIKDNGNARFQDRGFKKKNWGLGCYIDLT